MHTRKSTPLRGTILASQTYINSGASHIARSSHRIAEADQFCVKDRLRNEASNAAPSGNAPVFTEYKIDFTINIFNKIISIVIKLLIYASFTLFASTANANDFDRFLKMAETIVESAATANSLNDMRIALNSNIGFRNYSEGVASLKNVALNGISEKIRNLNLDLSKLDADIEFYKSNHKLRKILKSHRADVSRRLSRLSAQRSYVSSIKAAGRKLDLANSVVAIGNLANDVANDEYTFQESALPVLNSAIPLAIDFTKKVGGKALAAGAYGPYAVVGSELLNAVDSILNVQRELGSVYRTQYRNLRDRYYQQYNVLADVAFRLGRVRSKALLRTYEQDRKEIADSLNILLLELGRNYNPISGKGSLPFFGRSELKQAVFEFLDLLSAEEFTIKSRQEDFVERFSSMGEAARQKAQALSETAQAIEENLAQRREVGTVSTTWINPPVQIGIPADGWKPSLPDRTADTDDGEIWPPTAINVDLAEEDKQDLPTSTASETSLFVGFASLTGTASGQFPNFSATQVENDGSPPSGGTISFNTDGNSISSNVVGREFPHNIGGTFDHMIWGEWSGGSRTYRRSFDNTTFGQLHGYFVYGEPTQNLPLSGEAHYGGRLIGDRINGNTLEVTRGGVQGEFGLSADLSNHSLTGWMSFFRTGLDTNPWVVADVRNVNADTQDGTTTLHGEIIGNNGARGEFTGTFFGDDASEIGGSYFLDHDDDSAGVFAGRRVARLPVRPADPPSPPVEPVNDPWRGFVTTVNVSSSSQFIVDSTASSNVISRPSLGDMTRITIEPNRGGVERESAVEGTVRGRYSHLAWGDWNGSFQTRNVNNGQDTTFRRGQFLVGAATPPEQLASIRGTATYAGEVLADYGSQSSGVLADAVTGNARIDVNFSRASVSGSLELSGPNSFWANPTFNTDLDSSGNNVPYSAKLSNGNGSGHIFGSFYGPNAEETGGTFSYTSSIGDVAAGVFFASQQNVPPPPSNLPRFGSATFSGNISGRDFVTRFNPSIIGFVNVERRLSGSINLNADFENNNISGNYVINADRRLSRGRIAATPITREATTANFSTSFVPSGSGGTPVGSVVGTFTEDRRDQITGNWNIGHLPGGVTSARGTFTASQASN